MAEFNNKIPFILKEIQNWVTTKISNAKTNIEDWCNDTFSLNTHNHDDKYDSKGSAEAVQTNLNTHTNNSTIHVTASDKTNWNSKANGTHTHPQSDVTELVTALANKADITHTHNDFSDMGMPDFTNVITLSYSKTNHIASKVYKINAPGYFFYGNASRASNSPVGIFVAKEISRLSYANDKDIYNNKNADYVLCYHMCATEGEDHHTHLIPICPGTSTYFALNAVSGHMENFIFVFVPTVGVVSYLKSIGKLPSNAIKDTDYILESRIDSGLNTICTMINGSVDNTAVQRIKDIFSGDWKDNF